MSGYLNRLMARGQTTRQSALQPCVRSTSPIAEYDRRIGVAGFGDTENSILPPTDAGTDWELGQTDEISGLEMSETAPAPPSDITASRDVTVQRKMAHSTVTPMPTNPAPQSTPGIRDMPSAQVKTDRSPLFEFSEDVRAESPLPSIGESDLSIPVDGDRSLTPLPTPPVTRESDLQLSERDPFHPTIEQQSLNPTSEKSEISAIAIETSVVANPPQSAVTADTTPVVDEVRPLAAVPTPVAVPNREPSDIAEVEPQRANPNDIRPRRIVPEHPGNVPRLEPLIRDRDDLRFEEATVSNIDRQESPRISIGRINVEVIRETAPDTTVATSPKPLTAASVSVIGPLGGGVRPNVRLSLRQR